MGKRGPKPKGKVQIKWSANFAYAIGLLATDGNLSPNGRHIVFVSKDHEQLNNFQKALNICIPVTYTRSGYSGRLVPRLQFGDTLFYNFLTCIGITPKKSKTIGQVDIPKIFFFDFIRGCFDGDGTFYSYWDRRWKSSFMFYTAFASASREHLGWVQRELKMRIATTGHITCDSSKSTYQLKYGKADSLKIIKKMYYSDSAICLSRKREKIERALSIASH